jgi:lipoic acid synthetase
MDFRNAIKRLPLKTRLPVWFKQRFAEPVVAAEVNRLTDELCLHTICDSAICPNKITCYSERTATFLILGDVCTRHCSFCAVKKGLPKLVDEDEPNHLQEAIRKLNLEYAVITSVTRDDLPDGGAGHFARTVTAIHELGCAIEILIPDFLGSTAALDKVLSSHPEVIGHNLETVPRLYPLVRPEADYKRSINIFRQVNRSSNNVVTKSGLILGLGENQDEVYGVMSDLREAGCNLLTIGQYLQPSELHHPISRFVTPEEFQKYYELGKELGFAGIVSAPLVRSSFRAAELYNSIGNSL